MYTFDVRKRIAMQILIECCYVGFSIASWLTDWLDGVSEWKGVKGRDRERCVHTYILLLSSLQYRCR